MHYCPYDPKRLTLQDEEDAEQIANRLNLSNLDKVNFIRGFYCGIQNQERRRTERIEREESLD